MYPVQFQKGKKKKKKLEINKCWRSGFRVCWPTSPVPFEQ